MTTLEPHPTTVPAPVLDAVAAPFWEGCQQRELRYQRCMACGAANFQPVVACRICLSTQLRWTRSEGRGTVYSWSVVDRPPTPSFRPPFAVAIIDLAEGYQMLGNIIGCPAETIFAGMPVEAEFHPIADGFLVPYFASVPLQPAT